MFISKKEFESYRNIMKNGREYIIPERVEEWDDLCFYSLSNSYTKFILKGYIYKVIAMLGSEDHSIKDCISVLEDGVLPNNDWEIVVYEIVKFAPRGEEFVEACTSRVFSETGNDNINKVLEENKNFASQNKKGKTTLR